jgi:AraC-like DNA-binding protein/mannose-6-phosphate isomerase-like protein (cupin superfamily)
MFDTILLYFGYILQYKGFLLHNTDIMKEVPVAEQKEKLRHGSILFPIQRYLTVLDAKQRRIKSHWHDEAELTLVTSGAGTYHIAFSDTPVRKGTLVFIPPQILHSVTTAEPERMESETFVFHLNFIGAQMGDICSAKYLTPLSNQQYVLPFVIAPSHPASAGLRQLFEAVCRLYRTKSTGWELGMRGYLSEIVFLLLPYGKKENAAALLNTGASEKLKEALSFMEKNYAQPLSIHAVAEVCGYSECHFMRFFKTYTGMTCIRWLNNLRLEKAAELFSGGATDILNTALDCGYGSLSYFYRSFREKYGMTPRMFIKGSA